MSAPVRTVHVVAKTHLDLGFTASAAAVVRRYVDDFFPGAMAVADELRRRGGPERLVWTTGSWILHHALAAAPGDRRDRLVAAVGGGDLAWHALPLTTHTELMDAALVRSGLGISAELDARFGRTTTAAKMSDVPGHTRGLVPLLAEAGVTFLHLGVNPAWPVPDVPPVFRWRSPDGGEVVVAVQAGGYGGGVLVAGCDEVLAFLHTGDNQGPPTVDQVLAAHADLRARFPEAEVRASTLDAFARAVASSTGASEGDLLPVVTAEIGDPWLFGAASDPQKLSAYRALLRQRRALAGERVERPDAVARRGGDRSHPPGDGEVDRALLLVAEHTWGLDQKAALPDDRQWDRAGLARLRATEAGRRFEASWAEQRAYVDGAARLLAGVDDGSGAPDGPAAASVAEQARTVTAWRLGPNGQPVEADARWEVIGPGQHLRWPARTGGTGGWELGLDPVTGAVGHLVDLAAGRVVADRAHPLGLVTYQSFDEADYERFYAGLTPAAEDQWWARWDNTKPGIDAAGAVSGRWHPRVVGAWHTTADGRPPELVVRLAFPDVPTDRLGPPPAVWLSIRPTGGGPGGAPLELRLWWDDKPANRLPEALWCSFVPVVAEPGRWLMDKLGQSVSPLDVVRHGGRALHGVGDGGLSYDGPDGSLRLRTPDAPLVAPGRPNLLDADPPVPDLAGGWHVLLHDNCWGTNFPMWDEGPARFRFTLSAT